MTQSEAAMYGFAFALIGAVVCGVAMVYDKDRVAAVGFALFIGGAFALLASIPLLPSA